jgi:hypothetical protein
VTVTKQTDELYKEKKEYETKITKDIYNMEKNYKDTNKAKTNLDNDTKRLKEEQTRE